MPRQPGARRRPQRRFNLRLPLVRRRWALREDELHEKAIRAAGGADDFGDPSYLEGFRRLLDSLDQDARLHVLGRFLAEYQIVNMLTQRLLCERQLQANPAFAEIPIERPLVITGIVRTGSTALHYLMGANPDMQCLPYWLATHPRPRPPRDTWQARDEFRSARLELAMMYGLGEGLEAIHHITADGPEECRHLLAQHFTDDCFEVGNRVPTYADWYANGYHLDTYKRHKRLIQMIGSSEPQKRWLLKYPVHIRHIDALLAVYPDACIIHTHRDPATILPSYVSLCRHFRQLQERAPDPAEVAEDQMEVWARAVEKTIAVRQGREAQFHDVFFADFMNDPIGEIERIYDRFDVPFSEGARLALERWRADNPPGRYGRHAYDTSDFGITRQEVYWRFQDYLDYYNIPREYRD